MGDAGAGTVLNSIIALEELELERQFAQGMLNVTTTVFDRARREAEHRASFLLVYLRPTLPREPSEPNVPASIAFVAGLAVIAWLFTVTATAITLDQLD
jgi:capsule polysaccharide export protein KpsE/RkpR